MSDPPGQLTTVVPAPAGDDSPVTVISAAREVEQGARSALILADGLFRLDVIPYDDTIQTAIRSLSSESRADLRVSPVGGVARAFGAAGEIVAPSTGRFGGEVLLIGEDGGERAVAKILVGSVCHLERGVTSFTAQATLL
jgi:hypothetical protein